MINTFKETEETVNFSVASKTQHSKYTTCQLFSRWDPLDSPLEALDASLEPFDDIANVSHFIELTLEFIDLAENLMKASDLGVRSGHGATRRG